jgi:hypothetical protein
MFVVGGAVEFSRTRVLLTRNAEASAAEVEPINNPLYYNETIYSNIDEQTGPSNLPTYSEAVRRQVGGPPQRTESTSLSELEEIVVENEVEYDEEDDDDPYEENNLSNASDELPRYKDIFIVDI